MHDGCLIFKLVLLDKNSFSFRRKAFVDENRPAHKCEMNVQLLRPVDSDLDMENRRHLQMKTDRVY